MNSCKLGMKKKRTLSLKLQQNKQEDGSLGYLHLSEKNKHLVEFNIGNSTIQLAQKFY
jgi:hypothetical protein